MDDGFKNLSRDFRLASSPATFFAELGMAADAWQIELLNRSQSNKILLCCSRQSGKSTTCATIALHTALFNSGSLTLIVSPSQNQSSELLRKVADFYAQLGGDAPTEATLESKRHLEFRNRSRIVALPGNPRTVRSYSRPSLILVDEAAHLEEASDGDSDLMSAVRPMLSTNKYGRLIALSSPWGRRGWFWNAWCAARPDSNTQEDEIVEANGWLSFRVPWTACPRMDRTKVEDDRREMGPLKFASEYETSFLDALNGEVFSDELIRDALADDVEPLYTIKDGHEVINGFAGR